MTAISRSSYRLGIDIGGTFTDLVLMSPGCPILIRKVPSTTDDYCRGILLGLVALLAEARVNPAELDDLVHGTTVATNTILEGRGARTALITTSGFRDVLEMRRLRIPQLYNLQYTPPKPLVARRLRFEVRERMGPRGEVRCPLDEASVEYVAGRLAAAKVTAVAIALINSYVNPDHERRVAEILVERVPYRMHVTLSSDLVPEIREYERTSTAVVNSYIGPVVEHYLLSVMDRLRAAGVGAPLRVMQSNGGVMSAEAAAAKPACIIESGPAAGVIAASAVARRIGLGKVISLDMGGTTAKAALIDDGEPASTTEYEVGAGINLSSKLVKGGGHSVKLPFIDISEIGAGGGSIVSVDSIGSLKVGPRSAGAQPGPASYGLGGKDATFTDAMIVLGYMNPRALVGGSVVLDSDLAHAAVAAIAAQMGLSTMAAAWGIYAVAAANMTRAVKAVSTYRGRDPRDYSLIAFGGNGPAVAIEIARTLQMPQVIVPPAPGVFSAFGLLCSNTEYSASRTLFRRLSNLRMGELEEVLSELETQVRGSLARDGIDMVTTELQSGLDLRYAGQAYELAVPFKPGKHDLAAVATAFHAEHDRTYGHSSPDAPVDLVSVKVVGRSPSGVAAGALASLVAKDAATTQEATRTACFGSQLQMLETRILSRAPFLAGPLRGPLIVEEYDATSVVPPDCTARTDGDGNLFIRFDHGE
jgi:N-methylhydantoinase A